MAVALAGCSLLLDFSDRDDLGANPRCDLFEPNDSEAEATPVGPGSFALALCGAGDNDFFAITVAAGDDLVVAISGDDTLDLDLDLLDADGVADSGAQGGANKSIERTAATGNALVPGDYQIRVRPADGAQEGDYTLDVAIGAPGGDTGADAG